MIFGPEKQLGLLTVPGRTFQEKGKCTAVVFSYPLLFSCGKNIEQFIKCGTQLSTWKILYRPYPVQILVSPVPLCKVLLLVLCLKEKGGLTNITLVYTAIYLPTLHSAAAIPFRYHFSSAGHQPVALLPRSA